MKIDLIILNQVGTRIKLDDYINEDSFYKITTNNALDHYYLALSIIKGMENPLARAVYCIISNKEYREDLKFYLIAATNTVINRYIDMFSIIEDCEFSYTVTNSYTIIYTLKLNLSFKEDENIYSYKYTFIKKGNDSAKD